MPCAAVCRGRGGLHRRSNELGTFVAGSAAALLGAVTAVLIGGSLTLLVTLTWAGSFRRCSGSIGSKPWGRRDGSLAPPPPAGP